ncbi:MAG: hypothetical protein ACJ8C4_09605 [Gemmataceae bacterium]
MNDLVTIEGVLLTGNDVLLTCSNELSTEYAPILWHLFGPEWVQD